MSDNNMKPCPANVRVRRFGTMLTLLCVVMILHCDADDPKSQKSDDDFTLLKMGDTLMAATDVDFQKCDELCASVMDSIYFLAKHHADSKKMQFTVHVQGGPGSENADHKVVFSLTDLDSVRRYAASSEYQKSYESKAIKEKLAASGL